MSAQAHLVKSEWDVRSTAQPDAADFIARHHYAGGAPNTSVFRHGLYRIGGGDLMGVAMWLPPIPGAAKSAAAKLGLDDWHGIITLSRLAIHEDVPTNGASFLIGKSLRMIAADGRYRGAVTFADEWQGHDGAIYRATNWTDDGMSAPYTAWVDSNGRLVSKKAGRSRTVHEMSSMGHTRIGPFRKRRFIRRIAP